MQEPIQQKLAEFIAGCDLAKIDERFKADARWRILDWIGCAVAGAHYPQKEIAAKYFDTLGEAGDVSVVGSSRKYSMRTAAYLNGIAGHVCELDDGHRTAIGHPGSVTLPVALAVAQHVHATGAEFLKAVILGYDTYVRVGRTVCPSHYKWWHSTGTCGTYATTAAAASLLKLSAEQVNNAIGIAGTQAGGLIESFGEFSKATNIAAACQAGVDSASLAQLGFTGSHSILLGKKGFVAATCPEPHIENLENPSEATLVSNTAFFKVYSSCGHTNSPLDMFSKILRENTVRPEDVEAIRIETYKTSVDLCAALKVANENEAKFSLPYCFALLLHLGSVSLPFFDDAHRRDETLLATARKVTVVEDPSATARFPHRQATVTVTLKGGKTLVAKTLESCDDASPEQIIAKFEAAVPNVPAEKRRALIDFVCNIDKAPDVQPIIDFLVG